MDRFQIILAIAGVLWGACCNAGDGAVERATVPQPPQEKVDQALAAWVALAEAADIGNVYLEYLKPQVTRALQMSGDPGRLVTDEQLKIGITRWLKEYRPRLQARSRDSDGFANWHAWLLMDACSRSQPDEETLARVRADIDRALEMVKQAVREDFRARLKEYDKYSEAVETGLKWMTQDVQRRVKALQADPLYPALRHPLTDAQIEKVLKNTRDGYPIFMPPSQLLAPEEKQHLKRLEFFFKTTPTFILHALTNDQTFPQLARSHPFGLPHSNSTDPRQLWPIEVRMYLVERPKKE